MTCQCYYIDPETKQSVDIGDMSNELPETILRMNTRIGELIENDYNTAKNGIFDNVVHFGDVSHIIIHRLILESGNIYIGLQKSGRGLRFTGFYSLAASSDDDAAVDDDDDGGDAAATPVPEITADRVITELNRLKDNTQDMVHILVQFFGKLHLFHTGYSAIFENIRGF
jgi:hypothetical protein